MAQLLRGPCSGAQWQSGVRKTLVVSLAHGFSTYSCYLTRTASTRKHIDASFQVRVFHVTLLPSSPKILKLYIAEVSPVPRPSLRHGECRFIIMLCLFLSLPLVQGSNGVLLQIGILIQPLLLGEVVLFLPAFFFCLTRKRETPEQDDDG